MIFESTVERSIRGKILNEVHRGRLVPAVLFSRQVLRSTMPKSSFQRKALLPDRSAPTTSPLLLIPRDIPCDRSVMVYICGLAAINAVGATTSRPTAKPSQRLLS